MRLLAGVLSVCLGVMLVGGTATQAASAAPERGLDDLVDLASIKKHLGAFQDIADANKGWRDVGNRVAGSSGDAASVKYVTNVLKSAGYEPRLQAFPMDYWEQLSKPVFEQVSPAPATYEYEKQFNTMWYSKGGDVKAKATVVDPEGTGAGSGCDEEDWAKFPEGTIALVKRGNANCLYTDKGKLADKAGAAALVIYNDGTSDDRMDAMIGTYFEPIISVPTITATHKLGTELVKAANSEDGLTLRVKTDALNEKRNVHNIIADTPTGDANKTVVVGAHLDSVRTGPGINDNGSGSATILTIAQRIKQLGALKHKVRFAFWAQEEDGKVGSYHYVNSLSDAEKSKIALNLNFDMVGSTNFVRFVYDGDGSLSPDDPKPPAGSDTIEKEFHGYFAGRNLPSDQARLTFNSDYAPFMEAGIPAGGSHSGVGELKTEEQAKIYGGTAGVPYDPCYHQACDDLTNINNTVLDQLSDGAAAMTQRFAMDLDGIPARPGTRKPKASAPSMEHAR